MKGDGVVLTNTELLVPLLVVWVVAPKPEVVAAPKEKKAGWAGAGVAVGAGAAESPKVKDLPKLGTRAGLAVPCCYPLAGWGLAPGYEGREGLALEPKRMLNAEVVVPLKVSVLAGGGQGRGCKGAAKTYKGAAKTAAGLLMLGAI